MADALVKTLNRAGFQPIFLPQTGLLPPDLYNLTSRNRKPRLVRRGPLARYLPGCEFTPVRSTLPDIANQRSSGKSISGSASFLARCLACLGIEAAPAINLSFAGNTKFSFSLGGVFSLRVDPSDIDHALKRLRPGAIPDEYVNRGFLHIAYEYAFATSLVMQAEGDHEFDLRTDADLPQLATVNAGFTLTRANRNTITFEACADSDVPAFAYRAGRLTRDSKWRFYPEETYRSESEIPPQPYVLRRGVVLDTESPSDTENSGTYR
ncbi:hypothetical protein [Nocardia sp. NPDC004860]|uniref:hypothetical protein n=1 Tax=Nocardia sp. NPDC004860 TaxID=3154557 RepID=UPI0033A36BBB